MSRIIERSVGGPILLADWIHIKYPSYVREDYLAKKQAERILAAESRARLVEACEGLWLVWPVATIGWWRVASMRGNVDELLLGQRWYRDAERWVWCSPRPREGVRRWLRPLRTAVLASILAPGAPDVAS